MKSLLRTFRHPIRAVRMWRHYDYCSPCLHSLPPAIVEYFPHIEKRRSFSLVPHTARIDTRFKEVGCLNWDEAHLLYNYALEHNDRKLLEIGCWVGWSTVVFGLTKINVTVVDPVLDGMPQGQACRDSLLRANLLPSVNLIGGYSPEAVRDLIEKGERWSLFFIDGDHEGDAPLRDARQCHRGAEADSIILLHDACQANICEALAWLEGQGWQCGVHYTAQFIGVAWRGNMQHLTHTPDPKVSWEKMITKHWPWVGHFRHLGVLEPDLRKYCS